MSTERPCIHWSDGYCKKFSDDEVRSWCVDGPCKDQQPSNADRIRAMSDEELAKWVMQFVFDCCIASGIEDPSWEDRSSEAMLRWLKEPAEE